MCHEHIFRVNEPRQSIVVCLGQELKVCSRLGNLVDLRLHAARNRCQDARAEPVGQGLDRESEGPAALLGAEHGPGKPAPAEEFGFNDEMEAFGLNFCHGLGLGLHERPLISRLKIMADLDIAERRIPQDGRTRRGTEIWVDGGFLAADAPATRLPAPPGWL